MTDPVISKVLLQHHRNHERYRAGERISSAFAGATVTPLVSKGFAKKQKIQRTRAGDHLLMLTRTQAMDGTLRSTFERWYPGMANNNMARSSTSEAA